MIKLGNLEEEGADHFSGVFKIPTVKYCGTSVIITIEVSGYTPWDKLF